jgi:nicotinamide mononucleotide transporter
MLHLLEISSVLLLFAYMYFAYKQSSTAWLFGIAGSILSVILFFNKGFYGSMLLNLIYVLQGFFGYFEWQWKSPQLISFYRLTFKHHIVIIFVSGLLTIVFNRIFLLFNYNEFSRIDIFLAILSIVATFLEIKKEISCWWYWMFCNLVYSVLYLNLYKLEPPLYFYSSLMLALAIFSWFAKKEWKKDLKVENKF